MADKAKHKKDSLITLIKRCLGFYCGVTPKNPSRIGHLAENSQEQLMVLTELIKKHIPNCGMIILFGSYAKGKQVVYDEKIVDGVFTTYQSDFDIMVVTNEPLDQLKTDAIDRKLYGKVTLKYNKIFAGKLHAPPQYIVENIGNLAKNLRRKQPFFTDIITEGIMLYDSGNIILPEIKELSFEEVKEIAKEQFDECVYHADGFLRHGKDDLGYEMYKMGAFQLHQACENYYRAMGMVYENSNPKLHDLEVFIERTKGYSIDLESVFPRGTEFEKNTFKLLQEAYTRARYDRHYVVTKEELEYMLARVEVMKEIAHRLCKERLEYYANKVE